MYGFHVLQCCLYFDANASQLEAKSNEADAKYKTVVRDAEAQ